MKKLLILLCVLTGALMSLPAQIPTPEQARMELQKRNIDEDELRQRLLLRGIDIDNVRPEQLPQLQGEIEAVIAELEAEKAANDPTAASPEDKEDETTPPPTATQVAEQDELTAAETDTLLGGLSPSDIYGHNIFRNQSLQVYESVRDVKPPDTYQLGVGDEVVISIFGASQADLKLTIDEDGFIKPDRIPRIYLKGMELGQARRLLESRLRNYYLFQAGQISINISAARTIGVNIFGETEANGTFTISAINTAFNALLAAGGPTERGSIRNIKLIRGREERIIDVYAFLNDPRVQYDFFLQNNDILFVPLAEKIVSITGGVERPLNYELREDETLLDLINLAGGFSTLAFRTLVQVVRFEGNEEIVIDVDVERLQQTGEAFALRAGDQVRVRTVAPPRTKYVEIEGAVLLPGAYAFREGMQVSELLSLGQLHPDARLDVAFLISRNVDGTSKMEQIDLGAILRGEADQALRAQDRLLVYTQRRFVDTMTFAVSGAVRIPFADYPFPTDKPFRLADAILLAGGLAPNAAEEAFLYRTKASNNKEQAYLRVQIKKAITDPESAANIVLQPFDRLIVYGMERYTDDFTLQITGAVRDPQKLTYSPDIGIRDLILLAGGLGIDAAYNRVEVFRVNRALNQPNEQEVISLTVDEDYNIIAGVPEDFQLQPFDIVVVRRLPNFELQQTVQIQGEVMFPGVYALEGENERILEVLQRAGGLSPEGFAAGATLERTQDSIGYVVIELDEILRNPGRPSNIILRAGDILRVPKSSELVIIQTTATEIDENYTGLLTADGKLVVAYQGPKSGRWYVNEYAAGFDEKARRRSLTVQYPNGEVKQVRSFLGIKRYPRVKPGSVVALDFKPEKEKRERPESERTWKEILAESIALATSVLTVAVLIERL